MFSSPLHDLSLFFFRTVLGDWDGVVLKSNTEGMAVSFNLELPPEIQ